MKHIPGPIFEPYLSRADRHSRIRRHSFHHSSTYVAGMLRFWERVGGARIVSVGFETHKLGHQLFVVHMLW